MSDSVDALRLLARGFGALLGRGVVLGHGHAHLLGQVGDGIDEAHAVVLAQESDRVAVHAAAEAVVRLAGRR